MLVLLAGSRNAKADLETSKPDSEAPERDYIQECGMNLLADSGKVGKAAIGLPALYKKHSRSQDDEFLEYMFSIIYVESRFNKSAISNADAYGLMQMTRGAVEEAVKHCSLRPLGDMNKLHDSATNVKYGSCYLKKLLDEMDGDWTRTLIAYNGGYKMLQRYDNGESIVNETANYVLLVHRALNNICRSNRSPE